MICVNRKCRKHNIPWYKKINPFWAFFGNIDDGFTGDPNWNPPMLFRRPESVNWKWWRIVHWWLRNPAHNFTWYTIGVADKDRTVCGKYGDDFHKVGGGLLFSATYVGIGSTTIKLPYISYLSKYWKVYVGWRPSGAFGIKVNLRIKGDRSIK